eukprot:217062-Amphidinium_carterae.1
MSTCTCFKSTRWGVWGGLAMCAIYEQLVRSLCNSSLHAKTRESVLEFCWAGLEATIAMGGACARRSQQDWSAPKGPPRECVLEKVQRDGEALRDVAEVWRSDREVVLAAVQQDGWALQFAAEALKGDSEIVLAAARQSHGHAF